jgi:aminobenzoyl-glutamate utilization protein A
MPRAERADEIALLDALGAASHVREHRRHIHRRAELGWCEFATTAYLREQLARFRVDRLVWGAELLPGVARLGVPGDPVQERARSVAVGWGVPRSDIDAMASTGTGVVAEIVGRAPGPTVGVRVDIDALPITESEASDHFPRVSGFASEAAGVMHACGHDGHAAIGLGVAEALCLLRSRLSGTVRLLFQPAEEGTRGGAAFVEAGWLDDIETLLSLHLSGLSGLETGAFSPGVVQLLSTIKFDISLRGRAAHFASAPEKGRSALMAASAIALLSQALPRNPGARALINVGRIEAGTARNVVPEHGELQMEVRAETDELAGDLFDRVDTLGRNVGAGLDVEATTTIVGRAPAADSDTDLAAVVSEAGSRMGLRRLDNLTMEASDDASAMMRRVQEQGGTAAYAKVGTNLAGGNHTSAFDFDEASLPIAVELIVRSVLACVSAAPDASTA